MLKRKLHSENIKLKSKDLHLNRSNPLTSTTVLPLKFLNSNTRVSRKILSDVSDSRIKRNSNKILVNPVRLYRLEIRTCHIMQPFVYDSHFLVATEDNSFSVYKHELII